MKVCLAYSIMLYCVNVCVCFALFCYVVFYIYIFHIYYKGGRRIRCVAVQSCTIWCAPSSVLSFFFRLASPPSIDTLRGADTVSAAAEHHRTPPRNHIGKKSIKAPSSVQLTHTHTHEQSQSARLTIKLLLVTHYIYIYFCAVRI